MRTKRMVRGVLLTSLFLMGSAYFAMADLQNTQNQDSDSDVILQAAKELQYSDAKLSKKLEDLATALSRS